jgi:hypothetical protein
MEANISTTLEDMLLPRSDPHEGRRNRLGRYRILAGASRGAKFANAVIVGAVLSWGVGLAGQSANHNGGYWKNLSNPERLVYIEGYIDAMQVSSKKLENLRVAAELLHWKAAKKIFGQADREMIVSRWSPNELMHSLDTVYSDPKCYDLELVEAIELVAIRRGTSTSGGVIGGAK